MSKKMRHIGKLRILRADAAVQWDIGVVLRHFGCSCSFVEVSN